MTQLQFKCRTDSLAIPTRREIVNQRANQVLPIEDETDDT
jgi:hypothetical protein